MIINELMITNFKCFSTLNLELSNLNILTGVNNVGKSTAIQALLLLKQSYDMGEIDKGLILNGKVVNIGIGHDLLYRNSEQDEIILALSLDDLTYKWSYKYERDSDYQQLNWMLPKDEKDRIKDINLFHETFTYIAADRIGPQRFYEKSYQEVYSKNQVGYRGELFADFITEKGRDDKIGSINVKHPSLGSEELLYQLEVWLSEISPGIQLNTQNIAEAGIVRIGYKVQEDEYTPMNVGFGLSYVAPVVLSLLKAKPGDLVLLENPEAHLHPKGQRKMGELLALACAGGVQVIVETHSDHLLNGVRLSVKNHRINRNKVRLYYFFEEMCEEKRMHKKCSPAILDDGSLSDWPDGFFDEWDKAIDELL
jgi:predicted ATPase